MECKMPIIKILPHEDICPKGLEINAKAGENICQMLLDNNIDIEHACHIIVRKGFQSLNEIKEQEEDLLDMAWGLTSLSRLSCQVIVGTDDLVVEIPKYTINHAKEN
jgi:2Fe-2S ferredoxin